MNYLWLQILAALLLKEVAVELYQRLRLRRVLHRVMAELDSPRRTKKKAKVKAKSRRLKVVR